MNKVAITQHFQQLYEIILFRMREFFLNLHNVNWSLSSSGLSIVVSLKPQIKNIFATCVLDENSVVSILETTAANGEE